jgi:hypothetical protein
MVKPTRLTTLALAALAGVLATTAFGSSTPVGIGRMDVAPDTVAAGATNDFTFTFNANSSSLRGQTIIDFPPGWTLPQRSNPAAAGYLELRRGTCAGSTRILSIRGRRVMIATACPRRQGYQLLYHKATAPQIAADGYIFLTQTRSAAAGRKAKFRPLGSKHQPVVKVRGAPAVRLFVNATSVATAGTDFTVTVRAIDAYGNTASPYVGPTVTLGSSDPAASLPPPHNYVQGDTAQYAFTGTILRTPGTQTITATDSNGLTGQSAPIVVLPTG